MASFQNNPTFYGYLNHTQGDLEARSCPRCGGLFIRESLFDLLNDSGNMRCWALKCVQCGDVVDPTIIKHRFCEDLPNPHPLKRRRWSPLQADRMVKNKVA